MIKLMVCLLLLSILQLASVGVGGELGLQKTQMDTYVDSLTPVWYRPAWWQGLEVWTSRWIGTGKDELVQAAPPWVHYSIPAALL